MQSKGSQNGGNNLRSVTRRRIEAVSVPLSPALDDSLSDSAYRAKLAEEYGFTQIGEPVPEGITLKNVIDSLPSEVNGHGLFGQNTCNFLDCRSTPLHCQKHH